MIRGLEVRAIPAVLVVLAAIVGGCTSDSDSGGAPGDGDSTEARPGESPSSSPGEPTYSPEAGEVLELSQDQKWATMEQGRYAVQLSSSSYEVDVPDQWRVFEGRFLNTPPSGANSIFFVSEAPAGETELPQHPCDDPTGVPVGPSPKALASGLRSQPVLEVTKPDPVTVDGYDGLYVEVRIPDTVDADSCIGHTVALVTSGSDEWGWQEGFVGHWWILDVAGDRLVINGQCDTACAKDDLHTLDAMAESVTFTSAH